MASIPTSSIFFAPTPLTIKSKTMNSSVLLMRTKAPHGLRICCAAKPEIVEKVSGIVRKQLALPSDTQVIGETKFSDLGADSLDTVEIMMKLEEEFGVHVEEESAQDIATIGQAAELIEKLKEKC